MYKTNMENGGFEDAERSGRPMKVSKNDDTLSLKNIRLLFNSFKKELFRKTLCGAKYTEWNSQEEQLLKSFI